jgi:hypothetical protein
MAAIRSVGWPNGCSNQIARTQLRFERNLMSRIYFDPLATEAKTFSATNDKAKDALGKIAQLIPGEILGGYGAALSTVPLFPAQSQQWVALGCFILGVVGTAWYVGWQIGKRISAQKHVLVYCLSFAVWAYSLTGKTALPWIYQSGVAALAPIILGVLLANISLPAKEVK